MCVWYYDMKKGYREQETIQHCIITLVVYNRQSSQLPPLNCCSRENFIIVTQSEESHSAKPCILLCQKGSQSQKVHVG